MEQNKNLKYAKERFKNCPSMNSIAFNDDEGERVYFKRHWLFGIIQVSKKRHMRTWGIKVYYGD